MHRRILMLWVGIITAFVLLEKIAPAPKWISRAAGMALIAGGAWMLLVRYR